MSARRRCAECDGEGSVSVPCCTAADLGLPCTPHGGSHGYRSVTCDRCEGEGEVPRERDEDEDDEEASA